MARGREERMVRGPGVKQEMVGGGLQEEVVRAGVCICFALMGLLLCAGVHRPA